MSKTYPDGTIAVTDLDLRIGDGQLVVLVGPSGCGKTTGARFLLRLVSVVIDGAPHQDGFIGKVDVFQSKPQQFAETRTGEHGRREDG